MLSTIALSLISCTHSIAAKNLDENPTLHCLPLRPALFIYGLHPPLTTILRIAVLLCGAAWYTNGWSMPSRHDGSLSKVMLCGLAVVVGQFFFLVGLKMSSAVTASVWQPSQPIWTLLMAIAIGREKASRRKVLGVLLAFAGCVFMVEETHKPNDGGAESRIPAWIPNLFFFGNCLGTPIYVLTAKTLTTRLGKPALWVTAWAYMAATCMLCAITIVVNASPPLLRLMCPPPDELCGNGWEIPSDALWALLYWIFFVSALAYALITWGNQHLEGTTVSAFFALQPVAAAIVSGVIVAVTPPPHHQLHGPGVQHLGAIGVFAGLYLVITNTTAATHGAQRTGESVLRNEDSSATTLLNSDDDSSDSDNTGGHSTQRSGRAVTCVANEAYDPTGIAATSKDD
eukprot:m.128305 g.128305  ORF g.128305 m.128305 type:complete len:400 (+) comp17428_c0_seq3:768-1967(+)